MFGFYMKISANGHTSLPSLSLSFTQKIIAAAGHFRPLSDRRNAVSPLLSLRGTVYNVDPFYR
jgi:hypothetical protein